MRALKIIAAIGAGCVGYGMIIEKNAFRLRRFEIPMLAEGAEEIRILHISDMHLLARQAKKISWVRQLGALQPDFIINTGDNLSEADALPSLAKALAPLAGIPGVFVLGSNDFRGPRPTNPLSYLTQSESKGQGDYLPTEDIIDLLESFGWDNVEQARHRYELRGTSVEVRGCSDAHMGADNYPLVMGESDADLLLGVTHAPYLKVLDEMVADEVELIFAGHTHGGQVCLPGGYALTTNCDLPTDQARG
ncbi:MAG: metallophosphoesterase, partial [Propionibacteriaceae bacterium]|nr:metallophosphoesterase [Propionibacteriaceae bacterium]